MEERKMKRQYRLRGFAGLILFLLLMGTAMGEDACRWNPPNREAAESSEPLLASGDRDTYTGVLRVYVTEAIGRWQDDDNNVFHNAFLAFALDESISLGETDTLSWEVMWDGNNYSDGYGTYFGDISEDNIRVIAAVFNSAGYTGYSDPPTGAPFVVHEVDACAAATCGTEGYNMVNQDFTHTVLVEDGASTG